MSTVHTTRTLPVPVDRVWSALTDPEAMTAWFWPQSIAPKVTADVRPGGRFRIDATSAGFAASGVYREVTPPSHLVMTWQWEGDGAVERQHLRPASAQLLKSCVSQTLPDESRMASMPM